MGRRALREKEGRTVSRALIEILHYTRCLRPLHNDNGTDFSGLSLDVPLSALMLGVIKKMALLWPICRVLNDAPMISPPQGSVE